MDKKRKVATTNRSRVSIRVTKIFVQGRWRGRRVKISLQYSLITTQNLVAFCHTVCAHVQGREIFGMLVPPSPSDRDVTDP